MESLVGRWLASENGVDVELPVFDPCTRMPSNRTADCRIAFASLLLAAAGAAAQEDTSQELTTKSYGPALVDAPPMYVADPLAGSSFTAMPMGVGDGLARSWPRWFAGASGLVMTRTLPSGRATMQPLPGVHQTTADAAANWPGGVDMHVGRWFGLRQQHAIELIYWGVYQLGGASEANSATSGIEAIPQAPGVTVAGQAASAYLTNLAAQQIERSDVINDVEINWVYSLWDRPEFLPRDRAVNWMWLVGFRFFELSDVLTLRNSTGNASLDDLDFDVATNNNVYGGQVGGKFDWRILPRIRLGVVPKFMIGGNSVTNTSDLQQVDGTYGAFSTDGRPVKVHSSLGVFSWLGSVDTSVAWDVTDQWSLWLGYRVVGIGNIAQADDQWTNTIATPASLSGVTAGSSTIVHGGFAGFEGRY